MTFSPSDDDELYFLRVAQDIARMGGRASGRSKVLTRRRSAPSNRKRLSRTAVPAIVALFAIGLVGYNSYVSHREAGAMPSIAPAVEATSHPFTCDGRTRCSQMTSCEEAEYFLKHCPGTEMDGDSDGEPCEQQWCN